MRAFFIANNLNLCYNDYMSKKNAITKSKDMLKQLHLASEPIFYKILSTLELDIKSKLKLISMPSYKARVKNFESYYRKLKKTNKNSTLTDTLPFINDLLGLRIICPFLEDVSIIENQLTKLYSVVEAEKKGAERTFSEFGYESIHLLIEVPKTLSNHLCSDTEKLLIPNEIFCEIQIRTVLQDAWAEVEHELIYKAEFSPFDLPLRRKLYSMNATLNLAEIIFQEVRDYQNKFNAELDKRRNDFYEQADVLTIGKLNAGEVMTESFSPKNSISSASPFVKGTIDDMVLEALQAHNLGNLEKANAIYTQIINYEPKPNNIILSVIYKHRGMAYFAQNDYQNAMDDFSSCVHYDPTNFRTYYYLGIVFSVLNKENEALTNFDKSLEINTYQAHVHYRKALSLYHLNLFELSFVSLKEALKLGINEDECSKLQVLLEGRLDL